MYFKQVGLNLIIAVTIEMILVSTETVDLTHDYYTGMLIPKFWTSRAANKPFGIQNILAEVFHEIQDPKIW